jgi:hypothetical protein
VAAHEEAKEAADLALDWDEEAQDLPVDMRRESLVHREVKAVLAGASHQNLR